MHEPSGNRNGTPEEPAALLGKLKLICEGLGIPQVTSPRKQIAMLRRESLKSMLSCLLTPEVEQPFREAIVTRVANGDMSLQVDPETTAFARMGAGGYGSVHWGWQWTHCRPIALKMFDAASLDDSCNTAHEFCKAEWKMNKLLEERAPAKSRVAPAALFMTGNTNGSGLPSIGFEYCDGLNLHDLARGKQSHAYCAYVLSELSNLLLTVHRAQLVHMDVKPKNIIFNMRDRIWQLCDFGQSCEARESIRNCEGVRGGATPHYGAPEHLGETAQTAEYSMDVYALGVTAFELLTGQRPFNGGTARDILIQKLHGLSPVQEELLGKCAPPAIGKTVAAMLGSDPAKRPSAQRCRTLFARWHLALNSSMLSDATLQRIRTPDDLFADDNPAQRAPQFDFPLSPDGDPLNAYRDEKPSSIAIEPVYIRDALTEAFPEHHTHPEYSVPF